MDNKLGNDNEMSLNSWMKTHIGLLFRYFVLIIILDGDDASKNPDSPCGFSHNNNSN